MLILLYLINLANLNLAQFAENVYSSDDCQIFCETICFDEYFQCLEYYYKRRQFRERRRRPKFYNSVSNELNPNCGKQYFRQEIENYASISGLGDIEPLNGRIVGGAPALRGEFPWMVSLQKPTKRGLVHYCGGAIISDYFILTVAHCADNFVGKEASIRIRMGATDISNENEGIYMKVSQIIVHEGWVREKSINDIALYRTDRPIRYSIIGQTGQYLINPICMPRESYSEPSFAIVAGWGQFGAKNGLMSVLQKIYVPKYPFDTCKINYENMATVTDNQTCYGGEGNKDSCLGDSGGALIEKRGNQYFILGLVSYGVPCAVESYPTIYTKVSKYLDWIYDKIL